jgi:hypothetical protein
LRASTFLFSVVCDRAEKRVGVTKKRRPGACRTPGLVLLSVAKRCARLGRLPGWSNRASLENVTHPQYAVWKIRVQGNKIRRPGVPTKYTGSPYTTRIGTSERDPDFRMVGEDRVSTLVDISSQKFSVTFQPFKGKKVLFLWRGRPIKNRGYKTLCKDMCPY